MRTSLHGRHDRPAVVSGDGDYTSVEAKAVWIAEIPQVEMVVVEDSRHGTPVD